MDQLSSDCEKLKISAFSKYSKLSGNINNVTIGPNSTIVHNASNGDDEKHESEEESRRSPEGHQTTQLVNPLPIDHVLRELEMQRLEKVQEAVNGHYNKFESFTKMQKEEKENQWMLKQQALMRNVQESEQAVLETLTTPNGNNSRQNEKLIKYYQELIQRKMVYEQQLQKNKEKQRILNEIIEKIERHQIEFGKVYQESLALIKSCSSSEELKKSLGDSVKLLKTLPENFDEIIARCKQCTVDEEQLLRAVNILTQIKNLKTKIEEAVVVINKKKEEARVPAQLPPAVKENVVLPLMNDSKATISSLVQCVSSTNLKRYTEMKQFLSQHSLSFKELLADDGLKQFRFDCKKAVNLPVNAISAVSAEHLKDKYVKLNRLLAGKTVSVADKQINASRHPQGVPFCVDMLARKFVLQGDLMISSNPEAAFCYATIIISLWNDFPDFGKLILAYFYTQCPYLVPFYIPKTEEQTNEEYYVSLGYHYVDGQIEKQDKFLKRMTGILRLYFAILIAKPKKGQTKNPHGITNAWTFLVSLLKLEPQLDITATALHIFLETIGFEMERVYEAVFKKLLRIITVKFMPLLKKIDSGGPVSRLEVLLQDYKTKGHFERLCGVLPSDFW